MAIDKRKYPKHAALVRELGPEWKLQMIDVEICVCRNLGNGYDIEISGVGSTRNEVMIYVWDISEGLNLGAVIVHIEHDVPRKSIKAVCEELVERYGENR